MFIYMIPTHTYQFATFKTSPIKEQALKKSILKNDKDYRDCYWADMLKRSF